MMRKRSSYRPRPAKRPMMRPLREQIAFDMHAAMMILSAAPTDDARTDLAQTLNTIGFAIEHDRRFDEESRHLHVGAVTLQNYVAPAALSQDHIDILAHTCAVIDSILGLIDVDTLQRAEIKAVAAVMALRRAA